MITTQKLKEKKEENNFTFIRISKKTLNRIRILKALYNFKSYDFLLNFFMDKIELETTEDNNKGG